MDSDSHHTTMILRRVAAGESHALQELMPRVYDELHGIAKQHLARESQRDLLQTTALVHEAYLRLVDQRHADWNDRVHFMAIASTLMRRVLLDHVRHRNASKRGGGRRSMQLQSSVDLLQESEPFDLLALDDALQRLSELNERHAKIVEMRFFAGLSIRETADALGVSEATIKNDWRVARAWLAVELDL
ncbi:MAG: ECF-type sigma factor [Planctomycetota bacterium]